MTFYSGDQRGRSFHLRVHESQEAKVPANVDHQEPESGGRRHVQVQRLQPLWRQQRQYRPQIRK